MHHAPFITSLRKQQQILEDLIIQFAAKERLNSTDRIFYDAATQKVEQNLKRLRKSLSGLTTTKQRKEEQTT